MRDENLPQFKYQPNAYKNGSVLFNRSWFRKKICQCCGEKATAYVPTMYAAEDVTCVCVDCVASGRAAKKFNGEFVQDAERRVGSSENTAELFQRTPGYESWQGEYWLTCCNDYCAYIDTVGLKELKRMNVSDEIFDGYDERLGFHDEGARTQLSKTHSPCGYLFRCLHCGKYHLWVDGD